MKKQEKGDRGKANRRREREIKMKVWREAKQENGVKGKYERECRTSEHRR